MRLIGMRLTDTSWNILSEREESYNLLTDLTIPFGVIFLEFELSTLVG